MTRTTSDSALLAICLATYNDGLARHGTERWQIAELNARQALKAAGLDYSNPAIRATSHIAILSLLDSLDAPK